MGKPSIRYATSKKDLVSSMILAHVSVDRGPVIARVALGTQVVQGSWYDDEDGSLDSSSYKFLSIDMLDENIYIFLKDKKDIITQALDNAEGMRRIRWEVIPLMQIQEEEKWKE